MKSKLFVFLLFIYCFFLCTEIVAQRRRGLVIPSYTINFDDFKSSTIDSSRIRVWYALNATDKRNLKSYEDLQILEIGKRYTKYYSWFIHNSDSLVFHYMKKNPKARARPNRMGPIGRDSKWSEYYFSEYYKDSEKKQLTEYTRMPRGIKFNTYHVEDLPIINWTIHSDTTTIAEEVCQKATCSFRGRDFVAWFTTNIPYNSGPWKFGGLPGLILKISDKDQYYVFECVKITYNKNAYPITQYERYKGYRKLDRKSHLDLQRKLNENWGKTAGITFDNPPLPSEYDALELE